MSEGKYQPKVSSPKLERKKKNGMFINPPSYGEIGGFTGPSKLERGEKGKMALQGSPRAKPGKPI